MPAPPPPRPGAFGSAADRWALAAILLFFAALVVFGARYHWVEEAGTAERDGYAAEAAQIRAGQVPHDPYRPLLYPLATAGLAGAVGDPFVAARLLSNLAAAGLAGLAYLFGRRLAGPPAGAWALALTAVNPNVWILGQHASTDMVFALLAAAALAAGLIYLERPSLAAAVGAGLGLGLAAFTRANAFFLLPGLAVAAALAPPPRGEEGRRRRWGHALAFAASVLGGLIPHWALRYAAFGNAFHDENWKNLAFKLYGYPDWSYLDRVPFPGLAAVVRADPGRVVAGALAELVRFAASGAAQLFGTPLHVLLIAFGAAWALRVRPRPALYLLAAVGFFLIALATAFFTWGRLLLFALPPAYALAAVPLDQGSPSVRLLPRGARRLLPAIALLAVAGLAVKTFGFRLPAFIARHPYTEVATLERLERSLPPGAALAGSSPFLERYLHHPYLALPDAFGREIARPALYYDKVRPLLAKERVAYLVIGRKDLRDRPAALAGAVAPVPWLEPVAQREDVAVWRVRL